MNSEAHGMSDQLAHPERLAVPHKAVERSGIATSTPAKGFLFSGIACCLAEAVTIPVDVVKTRLQLQGELGAHRQYANAFDAVRQMVRNEGVTSLFKGLTPALLRQATYGTLRYGLYEPIKGLLNNSTDGKQSSFYQKLAAGTLSGAISSAICNPTDLVKVRLQADGLKSNTGVATPVRYRGTWHAFADIARKEGLRGFYRGVGPTCGRASVGAATEIATYDDLKSRLVHMGLVSPGIWAHVAGSLSAGLISTFFTSPFDVVKSRVMNQGVGPDGKGLLYRGMIDCFAKSLRSEGLLSLWKGFWPNYARVGPRVIIIFMVLEKLRAKFD